MRARFAKRWIPLFAARPMWGLIPVRMTYGTFLLLDGSPLQFLAGLLVISGFLSRVVGGVMVVEFMLSIFLEHIPIGFAGNVRLELLMLAISAMILFSGSGRFSIDRFIAKKLLTYAPSKKWERYVIAETPYCKKWYE